jgi:hypothetical protein
VVEAEDGLGEDAVEDHLAVRRNDISAVGSTPCDWVEGSSEHGK